MVHGDLARVRPLLFLGVQGCHRHRRFQAGEVPLGVPGGGLQAGDEALARRLWSNTCLTTIHLVAPERKSRHFVAD